MRRLLALALLLLITISVSAQEELPVSPFEIDSVQISPDGRFAVFRILPSLEYWYNRMFPDSDTQWQGKLPGEIYVVEPESGRVEPVALQWGGPIRCFLPEEDYSECSQSRWSTGQPSFGMDGSGPFAGQFIVWGESRQFFESPEQTQLGFFPLDYSDYQKHYVENIQLPGTLLIDKYLGNRAGSILSVRGPYVVGESFVPTLQVINLIHRNTITFDASHEVSTDRYLAQKDDLFVWLHRDGKQLIAGGTDGGLWHIYDYNENTRMTTAFAPVANIGAETLTYVYAPTEEGRSWWQVAVADPALSPEEAIQRSRELTNADAAESVRAALEAALIAEFSETGFSLHPGMTAVFDEFQIYDVLGVEREDTLLVPLEWRLAQPPEGESRPLDVEGPIPFPIQINVGRG